MSEKNYDIAIIGSGPGGYTAAIRAAQLKMKVALIEKNLLGGSCLNVGCIPTKAILSSADALDVINKSLNFGIKIGNTSFDIAKIIERKNTIVQTLRSGLQSLILANKIDIIKGAAKFLSKDTIEILQTKETIKAKNIIIATGSQTIDIPNVTIDHKLIFNSTSLLCHKALPKTLVIIGGGYIGCEFASFYARLGTKVTIIEAFDSIIASQGKDISGLLLQEFKKTGIDIKTSTSVTKCRQEGSMVQVSLNTEENINAEAVLVAVGRKPYIENLNLENLMSLGKNNEIMVNDQMQTSIPNIYAIGDVTGKWMLAHTASHEAIVAVDTIAGIKNKMSFDAVPTVIFTKPEIASAGITSDKAKEKNLDVETGKFPFTALGKAHALGEKSGFVQVIIDKKTKIIIGAQAVGPSASVLIAEMTLAIQNKLNIKAVMDTIHAHPTMSESWLEAVFISQNRALNFFPNVKL